MGHSLTNLHERLPGSLPKLGLAFNALLVAHDEHDSEGLLQDGSLSYFLLDRQADFEAHRVRFRPDPTGVNKPLASFGAIFALAVQATHISKTKGHEISAFQLASDPLASLLVPSLTAPALVQRNLGRNAFGDVAGAGETGSTRVSRVRVNRDTTDATENLDELASGWEGNRGGSARGAHGLWGFHSLRLCFEAVLCRSWA